MKTLDKTDRPLFHVTRVIMEIGELSPYHKHNKTEEIYIIEHGAARVVIGKDKQYLEPSSPPLIIPPGTPHQIVNASQNFQLRFTSIKTGSRTESDTDYEEITLKPKKV